MRFDVLNPVLFLFQSVLANYLHGLSGREVTWFPRGFCRFSTAEAQKRTIASSRRAKRKQRDHYSIHKCQSTSWYHMAHLFHSAFSVRQLHCALNLIVVYPYRKSVNNVSKVVKPGPH